MKKSWTRRGKGVRRIRYSTTRMTIGVALMGKAVLYGTSRRKTVRELQEEHWAAIYGNARATFDVWLEWLTVCVQLEESRNAVVCLSRAGGEFLLSEKNCTYQTRQSVFQYVKRSSLWLLMLLAEEEKAYFSVYPGSHQSLSYADEDKLVLSRSLRMEGEEIEKYFVLIGHNYKRYVGMS